MAVMASGFAMVWFRVGIYFMMAFVSRWSFRDGLHFTMAFALQMTFVVVLAWRRVRGFCTLLAFVSPRRVVISMGRR